MKQMNLMLKPASSACNLRCRYCFYADLAEKRETFCFGTMSDETVEQMLENLSRDLEAGDSVSFAFQGGEPTLAGLAWYRRFVDQCEKILHGIQIAYSLQTNGTLLNGEWAKFLKNHHFLVGLSVDGMAKCHNACRLDANGNGTYHSAMEAKRLLEQNQVEFNVLCTLTAEMARHPNQIWNWLCQNQIRYVQFTPCLGELDGSGKSQYALHPKKFASFYIRLFELWLQDYSRGIYRSIKLFDDVVNLLAYGIPTACGIHGRCQPQLVVEADGSAYPCDFYCVDRFRLGNLREQSPMELARSEVSAAFRNRPRDGMELCAGCRYVDFCGGGCRRMQKEVYYAPGDQTCGYGLFLDFAMPALRRIAIQQRNYRRCGQWPQQSV